MAVVGDDGGHLGVPGAAPLLQRGRTLDFHHRGRRSELPGRCWPCVFRAHKGRPSTVAGDRALFSFLICFQLKDNCLAILYCFLL